MWPQIWVRVVELDHPKVTRITFPKISGRVMRMAPDVVKQAKPNAKLNAKPNAKPNAKRPQMKSLMSLGPLWPPLGPPPGGLALAPRGVQKV